MKKRPPPAPLPSIDPHPLPAETWLDTGLVSQALQPYGRNVALIAILTLLAMAPLWVLGNAGLVTWLTVALLVTLTVIDARTQHLPNVLVLPLIVLCFMQPHFLPPAWLHQGLGALLGGGIFLCILVLFKVLTGRDGMGMGDVKLMVALGALTGWLGLPVIMLVASLSAGVFIGIRALMGKGGTPFAFGPFLCLGAYVALLMHTAVVFVGMLL